MSDEASKSSPADAGRLQRLVGRLVQAALWVVALAVLFVAGAGLEGVWR